MGFFQPSPRNRKRRGAARRSRRDPKEDLLSAPASDPEEVRNQYHHALHARIDALENFISKRVREDKKRQRMRSENILPPPERSHRTGSRGSRRISAAERRRRLAERNGSGIKFLALFLLACGIVWWLLKTGL